MTSHSPFVHDATVEAAVTAVRDAGQHSIHVGASKPPVFSAQVSSSFDGQTVIVGVSGELYQENSPAVWRQVASAVNRATRSSVIILDLTTVAFLDSSSITTLLDLHQRLRHREVDLRVAACSPPVRRSLTLADLDPCLVIYDSVEQAVNTPRSLRRPSSRRDRYRNTSVPA
jgi:anti-anti-sigma factor